MHNRPTKETALSAYVAAIAEMRETLTALLAHTDDHLGTAPDDVNWGHVGSANYVNEQLAEIARFLGLDRKQEQSAQACVVGETVKNDGKALKRLMEEHFPISDFRHTRDYVFRADLPDGNALLVVTEPVDEEGDEIRILGLKKLENT